MEKLKVIWKKVRIPVIIIAIILIILSINQCNNNEYQKLKGEYNILKSQYQDEQKKVADFEKFRKREKDSLDRLITYRELENDKLELSNNELEEKINLIKKRPITTPKDTLGILAYLNKRYNNDTRIVEHRIGLTPITAFSAITELEIGDNNKKIISYKDEQLVNKDIQIGNLEKDKTDIKIELSTAEQELNQRKALGESADANITNLEQQIKKLNKKDTFNKIMIPVALVTGGFLGYQLAK